MKRNHVKKIFRDGTVLIFAAAVLLVGCGGNGYESYGLGEAAGGNTGESYGYGESYGGNLVDNGLFDLSGLPNKSIPYGCNWDEKDAAGLPNGVHYYENLYGKYYPVYYIPTNQKTLYLTMDEGYEAGFTPKILDILKEKNVHAVFFITKQFFDSNPELIQRMIDEGHTIGNHTCLHPSGGFPRYVDEHGLESFTNDVQTLHKLVYDRFGNKVADTATEAMCGQVIYPAAVLSKTAHVDEAKDFLDFLQTEEASKVFEEVGFTPLLK